ncbi:MAG: DUF998 domain-containing protein, partial [Ilumatobacteraceae bacterium]
MNLDTDPRIGRRVRLAGLGGVVGPATFMACWGVGAVVARHDLSPSADAISRLAAAGAETRWLMTTGFITFGIGVGTLAFAVRRVLDGTAWIAVGLTALATTLVAAAPLDVSERLDDVHGMLAAAGYITLVAAPILAAAPLG